MLALTAVTAELLAALRNGFLDEMVGFRGYATFSKSDTIVSAFFFLVSEKRFERADLPARLFRLCGNKTSLEKRMQKFEGTSWAGQGN